MNFETVNFQTNDSECTSQRRWQQVLDFGCPVEERGQRAVWQAEASTRTAFEVIP
jgi:hypothetical protein